MKIIGSNLCPHCIEAKNFCDKHGIDYEFIDINASLANLKMFLKHRDQDSQYEEVKKKGQIGIPTLILDDGTWLQDWRSYLKAEPVAEGQACGLDGKGC